MKIILAPFGSSGDVNPFVGIGVRMRERGHRVTVIASEHFAGLIEAEGLDKDRWPARQLAALIDGWKNRGLTPDKVPAGEAYGFGAGKGAHLYTAYQRRLKELNACDFGAAPTIDRLIIISDAAKVWRALRQQTQPQVLHDVGILVFVHEHVVETALVVGQHIGFL